MVVGIYTNKGDCLYKLCTLTRSNIQLFKMAIKTFDICGV